MSSDFPWTPEKARHRGGVQAYDDKVPPRQCHAHNRLGERCKNKPIPGGLVCRMHGGATPLARAAAKQRLLAMVEPAFQVLMESMASLDEGIALRAAKIVLDRAGYGPQSKVVVTDERTDLSSLSREELVKRAKAIAEELEAEAPNVIDKFVDDAANGPVGDSSSAHRVVEDR